MTGYCPRSFFASLWTSTLSQSINMQKKNLANNPNIHPSWPHTSSIAYTSPYADALWACHATFIPPNQGTTLNDSKKSKCVECCIFPHPHWHTGMVTDICYNQGNQQYWKSSLNKSPSVPSTMYITEQLNYKAVICHHFAHHMWYTTTNAVKG